MKISWSSRGVGVVTLLVAFSAAAVSSAQSGEPARSVRDGVYNRVQADRGRAVYDERCSSCHAARMWGSDWADRTVGDLYETINGFMPADDPGSLSAEQSRDVIAYILRMNKLPEGMTHLPESIDDLKRIRLELPLP